MQHNVGKAKKYHIICNVSISNKSLRVALALR